MFNDIFARLSLDTDAISPSTGTSTFSFSFLISGCLALVASCAVCLRIASSVAFLASIFCSPSNIFFLTLSISLRNCSIEGLLPLYSRNLSNINFLASDLCSLVSNFFICGKKYVSISLPIRSYNILCSFCFIFCLFINPKPINNKAFIVASFGSPVSNKPVVKPTKPSAGIRLNGLLTDPAAPRPTPKNALFNIRSAFLATGMSSPITSNAV